MFFRILKNDLKRKRTMNVILFLFIAMATMFLASSVSNLITITGAIDYFMEISKVPDCLMIALSQEDKDEVEAYLGSCEKVKEFEVIDSLTVTNEQITIINEENVKDTAYQRTSTLTVQADSNDFIKIYNQKDELIELKSGEIAIAKIEAEENNLQIGDKISIKIGEMTQEFTIKEIIKDVVFGTAYMGFKRFVISQEDFNRFTSQENLLYAKLYCVNCEDEKAFLMDVQKQNFNMIGTLTRDLVSTAYIFDMLIAGILIIVSICLILIAFMVLRFTIVFTLQEDFREIGIMKAIGLKDRGIKSVYLIKYFGISVAAAIIGVIGSFPFGNLLIEPSICDLVVSKTGQNVFLHIMCAVVVVVVVLWFSNTSANSLKKYSAIDAIRNGTNGERYQAKKGLRLWKHGKLQPTLYMSLNDILSNPKRFLVLILTFCLGTLLILLPLNAIHTLSSDNVAGLLGMRTTDVYMNTGKADEYLAEKSVASMLQDLEEIEEILKSEGIIAQVGMDVNYKIPCYANDEEYLVSNYTNQSIGLWDSSYVVLEGREAENEDEIMITDISAKELEVGIGDIITYVYPNRTQEFIITGTYQSLLDMGKGFRVSSKAKLDEEYMAGILCVQIDVADMESAEACERIKEIYPNYKVMQTIEFVNDLTGGVADTIQSVTNLIVVMVLLINGMITALMMKAMLTRERGDVALLKSIGFSDMSIRAWQTKRILLVLVGAIMLAIICSKLIAPITIGQIFAMMGANKVQLEVRALEAYVLYPLLLLTVNGVVAFLCSREVKKVNAREVNNAE